MLKRGLIGAGGTLGGAPAFFGPRGVFGGGYDNPVPNVIDYITIPTTGNATDFGDLVNATYELAATSDGL